MLGIFSTEVAPNIKIGALALIAWIIFMPIITFMETKKKYKINVQLLPVSVSEKCENTGALLKLSSLCSSLEEHLKVDNKITK